MRTCVRCAAGWMYCALFCFSRLFLFYSKERTAGGGAYKFARSRLRFVLLWVFVSSGTDCRVRRRMHAPFPGPYVSTLTLILIPISYLSLLSPNSIAVFFILSFSFTFRVKSSSFYLSLSLSVSNAFARLVVIWVTQPPNPGMLSVLWQRLNQCLSHAYTNVSSYVSLNILSLNNYF